MEAAVMHPRLERRYRRLLRAFPPVLRAERGEEILGTLAETGPPGRRMPSLAEAASLVGLTELGPFAGAWLGLQLAVVLAVPLLAWAAARAYRQQRARL
jgi:hypothetical protein